MDDVVGLLDALGLDAHQERGEHAPKGSIGRVLDLPGGDLQVREDGPRDTPPAETLPATAIFGRVRAIRGAKTKRFVA